MSTESSGELTSIEGRIVSQSPLPVVLWRDEGQPSLASYDQLFLPACHSAGVANLFPTQLISNIHAALEIRRAKRKPSHYWAT